ncbi:Predicted acylesterase/phospholipase RssA, contains patatin domain [Alkalithermobacter thermoalcaliphilus JW-YL-7 = DSM 7308]|uniref:Patatin n=1 Tax=Alkalithermobacter thermoalcaliphilus JW-YL-7 = DSM 7308 TaxID=1121328 RepID=A0A150FND0_CLOPD|nr:Patatin [[Clostridium] paradoxum JW-YL-7 = DSM 7308]SHK91775.1 Predicted acylesterase/phospholipase RssA, contains patatin domain [[Clostridium] paradoxum JW-YL-7 = DSM 7308]
MLGLCLPGGGAKGAFQAGVVYGLYEMGVNFDIISGTSIGAINSYFIYKGCIEKLKQVWTNIDEERYKNCVCTNNILENDMLIDILKKLEGENSYIKSVYINYIKVIDKDIKEVVVDITKVKDKLDIIKYSSSIPYRTQNGILMKDIIENFDFKKVSEEFKEDIKNGVYDGYSLDGGLINNTLLSPFIKNKVKKLIIIPLRNNYQVPDYLLQSYNLEEIVVISPQRNLEPRDTLRFENEFCIDLFNEGYKLSKDIIIKEDKNEGIKI